MKVLKFGGTSVGKPEVILEVKKIVEQQEKGTIVVVSAFGGLTDQLIKTTNLAKSRNEQYKTEFKAIRDRHTDTIAKVIVGKSVQEIVTKKVNIMLDELEEIYNGVYFLKDTTPKILDLIMSFGERLSSLIISDVIENAYLADARNFIKTDSNYNNAQVNYELTNDCIEKQFNGINQDYIIVPGFIASNNENEITTLGRGGSDYSAAIIAAALDASILEIWTDVDGFMTADPRIVEKAYPIDMLSYAEAMELSHFGAKVVYTPTIKPVYQKNIPVVIKNTFNPKAKGTIISGKKEIKKSISHIKGVSSISDISLLTLQGPGMVGVSGVSMRLFGALAKNKINIILITQASSEFTITFAISPSDIEKAQQAIQEEFNKEINSKGDLNLVIEKELSIIAIVGEEMKNSPGISAILFIALGNNGINVIATAQGSSELNISVVIKKNQLKKALNAIHENFFLSQHKALNLFQIGFGNVGGNLLKQLYNQQQRLLNEFKLKLNLIGICDIEKMIINEKGISFENYYQELTSTGIKSNIQEFAKQIITLNLPNTVLIDCTASKDVVTIYKSILENYGSIVTANKIASSSEYKKYDELIKVSREKNVKFLYETNVGAGLPIIKTIEDLIHSGDKIVKIEAVLSGTLNFIFNTISESIPMSKAIAMAQEKGYSEPDPRIDLSGIDVQRKILILSRLSGLKIEQEDVKVKKFLPDELFSGTIEDFWKNINKYDSEFEKKRKELETRNHKWRFVAKLENGIASCELIDIDQKHPAYYLEGSNNIILITTERYKEYPMVIKGYGAGAEVTAAGVFADIIRIANI